MCVCERENEIESRKIDKMSDGLVATIEVVKIQFNPWALRQKKKNDGEEKKKPEDETVEVLVIITIFFFI